MLAYNASKYSNCQLHSESHASKLDLESHASKQLANLFNSIMSVGMPVNSYFKQVPFQQHIKSMTILFML